MIQGDAPSIARQRVATSHVVESSVVDFASVVQHLRRRWRVVAVCVLLAMVVAFAYLRLAPAQYSATALLLIDPKMNVTLRSQPIVGDANAESANIESQVEIIKSEKVAAAVVESQRLADDSAMRSGLTQNPFGWIAEKLGFGNGDPLSSDGAGDINTKTLLKDAEARRNLAARALVKRMSVKRLGATYIVEITAQMPSPEQAANVANAFAQTYIDSQLELREQIARRTSKLLQERTLELQGQATTAERTVEDLKFSGSLQGENSANARVTLRDLESRAHTYRLLHDKFLERFAETSQQQYISLSDAQVVSPAQPPSSKSSPRGLLVLSAGLFLGFSIGSALALTLQYRRPSTPSQLRADIPVLRAAEMRRSE